MELTKDKAKETLNKWKSKIEHLNLQMNLGAREAQDEFEEMKSNVKEWSKKTEEKVAELQESGHENLNDLRRKLEELRVQAALGRAEAEDAFEDQKKNLKNMLNDVENESNKLYQTSSERVKELSEEVGEQVDKYETKFDMLWLHFNLAKSEAKDYWEEKRKEISYKAQEMNGKIDRQMDQMEDRWEDFSDEMKKAWSHVKQAFKHD